MLVAVADNPVQHLELEPAADNQIRAVVTPLLGQRCVFDLDFAKLVAAHTPSEREAGLQLAVRHPTPMQMCMQLASQCLQSQGVTFVASPTGTVWRVLLKQSNQRPEISIEELQRHNQDEPKIKFEEMNSPTEAPASQWQPNSDSMDLDL
jgi:hypothetical protein